MNWRLIGLGLCIVTVASGEAGAQTLLPEIVVQAPSPIVRRPQPDTQNPGAQAAPATPFPAGTLAVVTDQFATVTLLNRDEIARGNGALGDVMFSKPGITSSTFAPGAASRPIVRGLDMHRIRVQENGVGANGASDLGEDHGVPIDPLSTEQIEVVRGPATLRWGSQAIGGVINASNNRIPQALPQNGLSAEFRGGVSTAEHGLDGAVLLDAGGGNFVLHADAFGRSSDDYRIPSSPYRFDPSRPFNGTQPNSAARSNGQSVGGSYLFNGGFVGASVSQFNSLYHIPGIDGEEHNTRIDMKQTKINSRGEYRPDSPWIDSVRFWFGHSDYKHNELGFATPDDATTDGIRQTFTNKEQEGRFEVQLAPQRLSFATLTTAFGVQAWHQQLTAPSPDGAGLFDPNRTNSVAGYLFNELQLSPSLRAQLAGRIEGNRVSGSSPDVPGGDLTSVDRTRNFLPKSASFGLLQDFPFDLVGSITAQYVERAPRAPELFSRGAHDATGTFDIGNPNLGIEAAKSIEVGLKRAKGPLRFEANLYYTRFNGFIFRNLTGETCDEDIDSCTPGSAGGEGLQAVYSQRDAIFRGGEVAAQYDVAPLADGLWGVDGQFDVVRATFTDGTNVPRIPPMRLGGGLFWRNENWLMRVGLLHAFAQNDTADNETTTSGYNLLKAELSYSKALKPSPFGPRAVSVGIVGDNLLDEDVRNAASFRKDDVLLPGRSVRLFANVKF